MSLRSFSLAELEAGHPEPWAGVDDALHDPGAFRLEMGVADSALLTEMDRVTRRFFEAPEEDKARLRYEADPYIGWCGGRYLAERGSSDEKEMFHIGPRVAPSLTSHDGTGALGEEVPGPSDAPLWPDLAPFFDAWHRYYRRMQVVAAALGRGLARLLEADEDTWFGMLAGNWADLAANYYPPLEKRAEGGDPVYNAAHRDLTVFTILYQDDSSVGGLSVQDTAGAWHPVDPRPGTLVVNAGELLTYLSGRRWRAAPHRVTVNPPAAGPRRARLSIPFFYRPSDQSVARSLVDPAAEAIAVGDWVAERKRRSLAATGVS